MGRGITPRNNLAEEAKPISSNELLLLLAPPLRFVRRSYGPWIERHPVKLASIEAKLWELSFS